MNTNNNNNNNTNNNNNFFDKLEAKLSNTFDKMNGKHYSMIALCIILLFSWIEGATVITVLTFSMLVWVGSGGFDKATKDTKDT